MTPLRLVLCALAAPLALAAQATARPPAATAPPTPPPPAYRGFVPGISYRAFLERARAPADSAVVRCRASPRTAQLLEGGRVIRDPSGGAPALLSGPSVAAHPDP